MKLQRKSIRTHFSSTRKKRPKGDPADNTSTNSSSVINKIQVPTYLHGSDFYQSLNADVNDTFSILNANLKSSPTVTNLDELSHLLRTLEFWGVKKWPSSLILFLFGDHLRHFQNRVNEILLGEPRIELARMYSVLQRLNCGIADDSAGEIYQEVAVALAPVLLSDIEADAQQAIVGVRRIAKRHNPTRKHMISALDMESVDRRIGDLTSVEYVRELAKLLTVLWKDQRRKILENSVRAVLPLLSRLLSWPDEETVAASCAALAALCDGPPVRGQCVVDAGLVPRLIELLSSTHVATQCAALLAGNKSLPIVFHFLFCVTNFLFCMISDSNCGQ